MEHLLVGGLLVVCLVYIIVVVLCMLKGASEQDDYLEELWQERQRLELITCARSASVDSTGNVVA